LTEKLSRRGYHLSREYGVDRLEMVSVADVMTQVSQDAETAISSDIPESIPEVLAYSDETCRAVAEEMAITGITTMLVVDRETGQLCGRISAQELLTGRRRHVDRELERSSAFRSRTDAGTESSGRG
jgi:CIC family chloride channel protein